MKVSGMDATNNEFVRTQSIKTDTKDIKSTSPQINPAIENKIISQMTDFERKGLPVSEKVIINAIEKVNKAMTGTNRKFEYSIHEKTREVMVKVVDTDTNEVVREIPPEKILDLVAKLLEMAGLIVDERR